MKTFLGAVFFLIVGVAGYLTYDFVNFLNNAAQVAPNQVLFEVNRGEGFGSVARRLEEDGLITSAFKLRIYAKISGMENKIRVGEYQLSPSQFPTEILKTVTSGVSVQRSITFQEGINRFEMAELVEQSQLGTAAEFLRVTEDREFIKSLLGHSLPSLEGYLFPETYYYSRYTTVEELVKKMVSRFLVVYKEVEKLKTVDNLNRHQAVIFASIVEKETGAKHERPLISSVFHNRMDRKMRLQTDPTVLYGILDRTKKMPKNITKKDLLTKDRYNTYRFRGLPFGPISNPGEQALKYTLRPANTEYLYFVSKNDGTHVFSKTYKQHQRAVRQYQLNAKARKGKSWRDLNKSSRQN